MSGMTRLRYLARVHLPGWRRWARGRGYLPPARANHLPERAASGAETTGMGKEIGREQKGGSSLRPCPEVDELLDRRCPRVPSWAGGKAEDQTPKGGTSGVGILPECGPLR